MNTLAPYSFSPRQVMPIDTSRRKPRYHMAYVSRLREYFEIPAFDIVNTWRGASEILKTFDFDFDANIALRGRFPITPPAETTALLTIMWRTGPNTLERYKLYEDVGEILWLPVYSGQKIGTPFSIEAWNVNPASKIAYIIGEDGVAVGEDGVGFGVGAYELNATLLEPIRLFTSRLITQDRKCDTGDIPFSTYTECVDPVYHLEDFEPYYGDYYTFLSPCERVLIKGTKYVVAYNLLYCPDDDTWHNIFTETIDGSVFLAVAPEPELNPPPEAQPFFAMINQQDLTKSYRLWLELVGAGNYHFRFDEDITGFTPSYNAVFVQSNTDGQFYSVILQTMNGNKQLVIGQTPYVP